MDIVPDQHVHDEEDEEAYASSSPPSSTQTSTLTWITWFTSLPGHEYFCEVAEDFIEDDFNLTGLQGMVPFWKEALEMVLDVEPEEEDSLKIPDVSIIESSAELLYGLVHQRFILTRQGLQAMAAKSFGACPRVFCHATAVVPCGRSDQPGLDTVKLYCPNCGDLYAPPSSRFQGVDGAFFGTTFPHLFYQTYRDLFPAAFYRPPSAAALPALASTSSSTPASPAPTTAAAAASEPFVNPDPHGGLKRPSGEVYQKRIYGFKVSERARSGPRMEWLRLRPADPAELERVDWRGRWVGGGPGGGGDGDDGGDNGTGELFEGAEDSGTDDDEEEEEEEEEEDAPAAGAGAGAAKGATEASLGSSYPPKQYGHPRALELLALASRAHLTPLSDRTRRTRAYPQTAQYACPPLLSEAERDGAVPFDSAGASSGSGSCSDDDDAPDAGGLRTPGASTEADDGTQPSFLRARKLARELRLRVASASGGEDGEPAAVVVGGRALEAKAQARAFGPTAVSALLV